MNKLLKTLKLFQICLQKMNKLFSFTLLQPLCAVTKVYEDGMKMPYSLGSVTMERVHNVETNINT